MTKPDSMKEDALPLDPVCGKSVSAQGQHHFVPAVVLASFISSIMRAALGPQAVMAYVIANAVAVAVALMSFSSFSAISNVLRLNRERL